MNQELKTIKKKYGEKMAQLCRTLFPTLLETEGVLLNILTSNFNEDRFLYENIIYNNAEAAFKNYIYSFIDVENKDQIKSDKTPRELLDEAGYVLYECHTEEEIQFFKKYYEKNEELCTFFGNRLHSNHVFFAVKKNVEEIKRENFTKPARQDEYGTSVISIQFSRGDINTLSIKNRYNHAVDNPDATFSNNLENIISGLSHSFEHEYNLNINQNKSGFELPNYVLASDKKFYRYNYEINNIYYCPNNIIIDNGKVKKLDPSKQILIDYFIINLENDKEDETGAIINEKSIMLYDSNIADSFVDCFNKIEKVDIYNKGDEKEVVITPKMDDNGSSIVKLNKYNQATIKLNKYNQIIGLNHSYLTHAGDLFLFQNTTLQELYMENLLETGYGFLGENKVVYHLNLPKLTKTGNAFMYKNEALQVLNLQELKEVGNHFFGENESIHYLNLPKLTKAGHAFMYKNKALQILILQELMEVGEGFFRENEIIHHLNLPKLTKAGYEFMFKNKALEVLDLQELIEVGGRFFCENEIIHYLNLPKLTKAGNAFMCNNKTIQVLDLPNLFEVGCCFFEETTVLRYLNAPFLLITEYDFLRCNPPLEYLNVSPYANLAERLYPNMGRKM